jgi:hypothetical protein
MPRVGDLVTVHDSPHSYPLPPGLENGTVVRLVKFDPGYWTVEKDGQRQIG